MFLHSTRVLRHDIPAIQDKSLLIHSLPLLFDLAAAHLKLQHTILYPMSIPGTGPCIPAEEREPITFV